MSMSQNKTKYQSPFRLISKDITLLTMLSVLCIVSFLLLNEAFIQLITSWGFQPREVNIDTVTFWRWLLAILWMGILPALLEEIVFRGILLKFALRLGSLWAILITSVLFSIYHLNWAQTLYQFILGAILAVIVIRTGRFWYAIILHFINNFIVITYTYIASEVHTVTFNWQTIVIMLFLATAGTMFIIAIINRLSIKGDTQNRKSR